MVNAFDCEKCKNEIKDYKNRVQIMDEQGFTHSYCSECGQEEKNRLDARESSIK